MTREVQHFVVSDGLRSVQEVKEEQYDDDEWPEGCAYGEGEEEFIDEQVDEETACIG